LFIIIFYVIFENIVINYRPVILGDTPELSYPSSHIMIVTSVMVSSMIYLHDKITSRILNIVFNTFSVIIILIIIIGRFLSGVHWFTDILGGLLLSGSLIMSYYSVIKKIRI
jgi:membrane-associated phospholipid phosphatase